MPDAANNLAYQLTLVKLPDPTPEYRFAAHLVGGPGKGLRARLAEAGLRDWRFDLAWPEQQIAIEVDGGGWTGGRHSRGLGMESDCAKLSTAVAHGWRVLRVTPKQVKTGQALAWLEQVLQPSAQGKGRWALDHCS